MRGPKHRCNVVEIVYWFAGSIDDDAVLCGADTETEGIGRYCALSQ